MGRARLGHMTFVYVERTPSFQNEASLNVENYRRKLFESDTVLKFRVLRLTELLEGLLF